MSALARTLHRTIVAATVVLGVAASSLLVSSPVGAAPSTSPTAASSAVADPAKTATFGIGPANAKGVDGRSTLTFLASPGSHFDDRVAVVNLSTQRLTLSLYTRDANTSKDGSTGYLAQAARNSDAGTWITLRDKRSTLTLAPRQTRVVPISVDVPRDVSPGDHVAGVIASLTSQIRSSAGKLSNFEQRVALRTTFRISGAVRAQLAVENLDASYAGTVNPFGAGAATVTYTVRNTGNVTLGARQQVKVSGLFGEDAATAVANVPPMLPKGSTRVSVTIADVLPQGHLTARVALYPLVVKGTVTPNLASSFGASTGFWGVPWSLVGLVLLLALAVTAVLLLRRRQARRLAGARHRRPRPSLA